jgi:hypothetical protein
MSPEQCRGDAVDGSSDQYSLAVMAYELLAGQPPFQGSTMRLMYQHVNTPPEPPSRFNPRLSRQVDEVLVTALAKRPEDRFRSVTAFANAFKTALQAMEVLNAPTLLSSEPSPKMSGALPDTLASSGRLAEAMPPLPPATAAAAAPESLAPDAGAVVAPAAQGWTAASTGPTAPPLPKTLDVGRPASGGLSLPGGQPGSGPLPAPAVFAPSGPSAAGGSRKRGRRRVLVIAAAVLVLLALAAGGVVYALPSALSSVSAVSSATVTITPASKNVGNTFTISTVQSTPDASKQQVAARLLSVTTPAQTKTVNATGKGTVPGTGAHATGQLRVVNYEPYPVTVYAGSVYPNDARYGNIPIDMVADATVTVQHGGSAQVDVPAHILQLGDFGNQLCSGCPGNYVYTGDSRCNSNSFVNCWWMYNDGNFTGGVDPQTYTAVQQSDIDNAAKALEAANPPDPKQVLQGQISPNEQLVGTPQCTQNTPTADHKAGDQASQVTVSVTFTCTGEVYDHAGAVMLAANLLTQQASVDPGEGYALVGQIKTAVTNASADAQGTVTIMVSAQGRWVYHFTDAQIQAFARLIAGKSTQEAQQVLAAQSGIASAAIHISGGNGQTLPTDPQKIKLVIQAISATTSTNAAA